MHWVDRGTEPPALKKVRRKHTSRWVKHYRHGQGTKPSDDHWRDFHEDLRKAFSDLCAYCEETCKGEVDHFHPKSKFPEDVYRWSNWLFACHDCNHAKSDEWPSGGYVDPCAKTRLARPEEFFDFDWKTGEIVPKPRLSRARHKKAVTTIRDLKLNAYHKLKDRLIWVIMVGTVLRETLTAGNDVRPYSFLT